jgi:hypothetical protein
MPKPVKIKPAKVKPDARIVATDDLADELYRRAVSAMFRTDDIPQQPAEACSGVEYHRGLNYMVLRNTHGVVACYRVRRDGVLKRLTTYPDAIR